MEERELSKRLDVMEENIKSILGVIIIILICLFLLIGLLEAKGIC